MSFLCLLSIVTFKWHCLESSCFSLPLSEAWARSNICLQTGTSESQQREREREERKQTQTTAYKLARQHHQHPREHQPHTWPLTKISTPSTPLFHWYLSHFFTMEPANYHFQVLERRNEIDNIQQPPRNRSISRLNSLPHPEPDLQSNENHITFSPLQLFFIHTRASAVFLKPSHTILHASEGSQVRALRVLRVSFNFPPLPSIISLLKVGVWSLRNTADVCVDFLPLRKSLN